MPFPTGFGWFRDVQQDIKTTRWLRGFSWFLFFSWTAGLTLVLALLLTSSNPTRYSLLVLPQLYWNSGDACLPDGTFALNPNSYSYWKLSGFFQITLAFGSLSFTQAKVIDVAWDVVVGRGGQALLAFVSWRVFTGYVTCSMEEGPITFKTFRTIYLEDQPSLFSIIHLIRDFSRRLKLQSKTAMTFMVTTMIFTLVFPTLASAMTGYNGKVQAFVQDHDQNFVRFSSFSRVLYVIHDGDRVNQTKDYLVLREQSYGEEPALYNYESDCELDRNQRARNKTRPIYMRDMPQCYTQNNVSDYVAAYGFNGKMNASSTFMQYSLQPPVLNISVMPMYSDTPTLFGYNRTSAPKHLSAIDSNLNLTFTWSNAMYDLTYVNAHGSCQPVGQYSWGFAFIQLILIMFMVLIWTIGIYTMWLKARMTMQLRGREDVAAEMKAVLELASAIETELEHDENPRALTERQLRRTINNDLKGGQIAYTAPFGAKHYSFRKALGKTLKREKWWVLAITVCTLFTCSAWMFNVFATYGAIIFTFGLVFARITGSTTKSRIFFASVWLVVALVIILVMTYLYNRY